MDSGAREWPLNVSPAFLRILGNCSLYEEEEEDSVLIFFFFFCSDAWQATQCITQLRYTPRPRPRPLPTVTYQAPRISICTYKTFYLLLGECGAPPLPETKLDGYRTEASFGADPPPLIVEAVAAL